MNVHFSIVIPVYNAENTLWETLNSVLDQSYKKFEVICINDGSTDGSEDIILKWKEENPELDFTLLNQTNQGLGNARNRGVNAAKHPWTAFLDADDLWVSQKLELMANDIPSSNCDILHTSFKTFGRIARPQVRSGYSLHSVEDLLVKGNPIMPSATIARTSVLLEYPFSEDASVHGAEDFDLWIRLLHDKKVFHYLDSPLTLYRETGGMSTRIAEHIKHVINVISKYHELGWFGDDVYQKALDRKNWEAGRYYHKNGQIEEALQYYSKAGILNAKQKTLQLLAKLKVSC